MKRCWSLINLRIAVTLSFSEKIFPHVNGIGVAVVSTLRVGDMSIIFAIEKYAECQFFINITAYTNLWGANKIEAHFY